VTPDQEAFLRRLALCDETTVAPIMTGAVPPDALGPEAQTLALARVAALIGAESPPASYQWAVESALAAGASEADIVDVLVTVAPIVGLARTTAAAPQLALALGYDIDAG
jgi:hypothetical protein